MDVAHTFELAFGISARNNPEIIFIIEDQHLIELEERIKKLSSNSDDSTKTYLGEHACTFTMPSADLFGTIRFGYGECGYVVKGDGTVAFHVELTAARWVHFATLTIHVLSWALSMPFELPSRTNQRQALVLYTVCDHYRRGGYGHAISGYVYQPLNEWLREYARANKDDDSSGVVSVPKAVIEAMKTTWNATCVKSLKEYGNERELIGMIRMNGAFILHCFGNACDMGVYPDGISLGIEMHELQCHNLDGAVQQLTLLAGLAKLCQLASGST